MGARFLLVMIVMFVLKSLILFLVWNHAFLDMITVLKPITVGQAFAAMGGWMLLTFSFTYKES